MITLQELSLQRGSKLLFDHASLIIFSKQKIGLIGINGSGKSSLFSLLLGGLEPDSGSLSIDSSIKVAHLTQEIPHSSKSALQFVLEGDVELNSLLMKLRQAEKEKKGDLVAMLHLQLSEIDGYAAESKAAKLLNGLGFKDKEQDKPVNEFSGGWRMRLKLAQVLMMRSDLLLLDEPTNHLDLDAIVWLERWLKKYDGTLIVISHDREFLDNVVSKIVHINQCKLDSYSGNYSSFEEQRATKLALEEALFNKQQAKIAHLSKFVDRFRAKATKARQAQSRVKALERMEKVKLTYINSPFSFGFEEASRCSAPFLKLENSSFAYGNNKILDHVNFSLNPGDRVGILGPNGAGKSTLLKILNGSLEPGFGNVFRNKNLKIGYFAQHQIEQLKLNNSALSHVLAFNNKASEQVIRNFLGGFGFKGDRAYEPINNFSGGEKARLVLALLVWQKPNLLLLDEPTNHLDLDMRKALAYALQEFTGALVLISHDRYMLRTTVDELFLLYNGALNKFDGDLNDYQKLLLDTKKQRAKDDLNNKVIKNSKQSDNKIKQAYLAEEKLQKLYIKKEKLNQLLIDESLYRDDKKNQLDTEIEKLAEVEKEILFLEQRWFELNNDN